MEIHDAVEGLLQHASKQSTAEPAADEDVHPEGADMKKLYPEGNEHVDENGMIYSAKHGFRIPMPSARTVIANQNAEYQRILGRCFNICPLCPLPPP